MSYEYAVDQIGSGNVKISYDDYLISISVDDKYYQFIRSDPDGQRFTNLATSLVHSVDPQRNELDGLRIARYENADMYNICYIVDIGKNRVSIEITPEELQTIARKF